MTWTGLAPVMGLAEYVSAAHPQGWIKEFVGWGFFCKLQNRHNGTHTAGGIGATKEVGQYYPFQHCRLSEPYDHSAVSTYHCGPVLPRSN